MISSTCDSWAYLQCAWVGVPIMIFGVLLFRGLDMDHEQTSVNQTQRG